MLKNIKRQPLETICWRFWKKVMRLPLRIVLIPAISVIAATIAESQKPVRTPDEKSMVRESVRIGKMFKAFTASPEMVYQKLK